MSPLKMMLFFCLFGAVLLAAVPNMAWLLSWCTAKCFGHTVRYAPFGWTALAIVLAFWLLMFYGTFIGRWRVRTTELEYSHPDIPEAFDGFRIVHISDLHLSTFDDNPKKLQHFVDVINVQRPDLICFTGDLVTIGRQEAEPYTETLKGLKATYGVASVLGNHDFLIYERSFHSQAERTEAVEQLAAYEREELGWKLLRNESTTITAPDSSKITILGVDNKNCSNQGFKTIDRGDLAKAMQGTDGFRILLSHDPSHWTAEVVPDTDIPLTLSGHTHAAQIRIFGWTPAKVSFIETDGRYDQEAQTLYINIGLGCTAPIRIGANPEVTVMTLAAR